MPDDTEDDRGDDDTTRPEVDAEVGAAVDDAMESELKRQRARFVQEIMGADRAEGVGRGDAHWEDGIDRELGTDRPDDPVD